MQIHESSIQQASSMKKPDFSKIDVWVILFFILLMLIPFIIFSGNGKINSMSPTVFLPEIDTIGGDTAAVIINFDDDTLYENFPGMFSSLTFAMNTIPDDTVLITAYPDGQLNLGGGAGMPVQLIFGPYPTALNPQEIKVKPVNDEIFEGFHSGNITFSVASDDASFDIIEIPAIDYTIEDNDLESGINFIYETDTFLTEGLTGVTLLLSLQSIPDDTVYITADPDGQIRITALPDVPVTLVFPPNSSSLSFQSLNVRAYDDTDFEGPHTGLVDFTITTADPEYAVFAIDDIVYDIVDDDVEPGINFIYEVDTFLTEGLTGVTLLLSLQSIPADTVYITADPDAEMRITGVPDEAVTLTFPPNSSSLSFQSLNVRAYDDTEYEGAHTGYLDMSLSTLDIDYAAFILDDITYDIVDNDLAPGINYAVSDTLALDEATLDEVTVTISLNSVPTDTVIIKIIPDEELRLAAGPGEPYNMIFAPNTSALNDHVAQIKAYDDLDFEGLHFGDITFEIITVDADYAAYTLDGFVIEIADNDPPPGINFNVSDPLELDEATLDEVTVTISLNSIPSDTVIIKVIPDEELRIAAGPGETYDMIFAPNTSALNDHIALIKAFDDFDYEGLHYGDIAFEIITDDMDYAAYTLDSLLIEIADNDLVPGIAVTDTAGLAGIEGDATLAFTMVLTSVPEYTVTINADPDIQLDLGKGRDVDVNYKFKTDSALIPQTAHITIYDDALGESDHVGKIVFSILTEDVIYETFTIDTVVVHITDNDGINIINYDPATWNMYPSVSNGMFHYNFATLTGDHELQVYNTSGQCVYRSAIEDTSGTIDLSHMAVGAYTAVLIADGPNYYTRIEIIR